MNTEYPKYFESEEHVWRATSETDLGSFWKDDFARWQNSKHPTPLVEFAKQFHWPEITPQRAFELTGDKEILKVVQTPDSDPTCHCGMPKSDCDRHCQLCGKEECNCFSSSVQPSPEISQEKVGASPPQWIPASERLPEKGKFVPVIIEGWSRIGVAARSFDRWVICEQEKNPGPITHWMELPTSPPKPQTQAEKDEEWIETKLSSWTPDERRIYRLAARETLTYARGEKGEK